MKITNIEDVEIGHWITFISRTDGVLTRRFYKVVFKDNNLKCVSYCNKDKPYNFYDTIIDNLFVIPSDEVYSTFEEIQQYYPEEFI